MVAPPVLDTYTEAQFAAAFPRETTHVEFKTGLGREPLQEALVAMSNRDGGVILVGVRNDGTVAGKRLDQGAEEQINEIAFAVRDVGRFECKGVKVGLRDIIAISLEQRHEGFSQTSDGRTLVRHGPRNAALYGADLRDFLNQRALHQFERTASSLSLDDAEPFLLQQVRDALGISAEEEELVDRLFERGLCREDGILTIAGALILTNPKSSMALSKAVVEVRRYADDGPNYNRRVTFDGPVQSQIRDATTWIFNELGTDLVVSGLYRFELDRIPEVVIRETIANAVGHRNYEVNRTAIVVELRPDKVVVRSPGTLPEPVTVQTLRSGQAARNPALVHMLRRFALAEDAGRGIDVIQDSMREALLDPPVFEDDGSSVVVRLPLSGQITQRERVWVTDLEQRGAIRAEDRVLLVHAGRGEPLTNGLTRDLLGTPDSGEARRALQRLRDAGVLRQVGSRGAAQYWLADSIAPPAAYRMSPDQIAAHVLEAAREQPLTNEAVRSMTGLSRADALSLLRGLVRDGKLRQTGSRRGTRYLAV